MRGASTPLARPASVAALVMALTLAGCADTGADTDGTVVQLGDGDQVELLETEATAGRGAISGVVVDEAIRPLAGVNVTLLGPETQATTDEQGLFLFADLPPGLYTLSLEATLYLPTQTTAEVVPGETAKVRVVLPQDSTPRPYHTTQKFDGYIEAGNGLVNQAWELFVNGTAGVPLDSCTCQFYYTLEEPADTHIVEVTWEQSVENPTGDNSGYWAIWDHDGGDYQDDGCDNPCLGRVDAFFPEESRSFHIDIWLDSGWVQVGQTFSVFLSLFYNGGAPEGWSFVAGDP